jgi:hypothetical protein
VTRARRRLAMLLVGAGTLLSVVSPAAAQDSSERRLVAKYSPFVMLREQNDPSCDNKEEQYLALLYLDLRARQEAG